MPDETKPDREYNLHSFSERVELIDEMMKGMRDALVRYADKGYYVWRISVETEHIENCPPKYHPMKAEVTYVPQNRWFNNKSIKVSEDDAPQA